MAHHFREFVLTDVLIIGGGNTATKTAAKAATKTATKAVTKTANKAANKTVTKAETA